MLNGFNITLLAGVLTSMLLTFLNRRVAAPVVILLLAFYVALVGGDPAVVRAGIMGAITLLAILAGRPADALTSLGATVLKVAHHGSGGGTTLRFLEAVHPQLAVISVGVGNRFGHPAPEVLRRLEQVGAQVWRTDECGDVEVVTDGERLWVRTGRGCLPEPVGW